jgi:hypothetical protein
MRASSLALGGVQRRLNPVWPVPEVRELSKLKLRQRFKIAEIRLALIETGHVALDEQATAIGLSRSTAWSVLHPRHKSSGLSARTISRILRSPRLPSVVHQRMLEYMQEKSEGQYGHTERRRRQFAECLLAELAERIKFPVEGEENDRASPIERAATDATDAGGCRTTEV